MKATPGPWYLQKRWFIKGNDDSVVAKVHPWDETGCREEDHANAALIAAAPDLLDVVKGFRQKLSTYVGIYSGDKELKRLLEDCDAAIRKAEGGAE